MPPTPHPGPRTGAERLLETAVAAGSDVCFANPGTTEMPLVAALDAVDGVRPVLALFEGVCTGAANGSRMGLEDKDLVMQAVQIWTDSMIESRLSA